jgi:hypothetical protein
MHHDRCFAGYVGPGDAHGHADVGLLERGGIVDAVPGRGDDLAEVLEGSDDPLLMLGPDPGEHHLRMGGELVRELGDAHRLELLAADHAGVGAGDDADASGDGFGGYSVVACDHGDPDSAFAAGGNGVGDVGAGRVHHGHQPQQGQAVLREVPVGMAGVEVPAGDGEDPQCFAGQLVVDVGHLAPVSLGERDVGACPRDGVAPADQLLW